MAPRPIDWIAATLASCVASATSRARTWLGFDARVGIRSANNFGTSPKKSMSSRKNPKTTDMLIEQIRTAFLEDVAVFEAQQRNLLMIPNPPQTDINADAGVIQARRILDRLYKEEQAAAAKMAAAE